MMVWHGVCGVAFTFSIAHVLLNVFSEMRAGNAIQLCEEGTANSITSDSYFSAACRCQLSRLTSQRQIVFGIVL